MRFGRLLPLRVVSFRLDDDGAVLSLLDLRVARLAQDATLTSTSLTTQEAHVAVLAIGLAPAVLHLPVVLAIVGAITDDQNAVVQLGAAHATEDAALVELEDGLVRLNGDGHWLLGDSGHEGLLAASCNVLVACHIVVWHASGAGACLARSSLGLVCVGLLSADSRLLGVLEGVVHETAVAALVAEFATSAIHELLLREGHQLTRGQEVGSLKGASSGESPARAALALVLHRSDGSLRDPVHRRRQRLVGGGHVATEVLGALEWRGWLAHAKVLGRPLVDEKVGKLVHIKGEAKLLGVHFVDVLHVRLEDAAAVGLLLSALVCLTELGLEVLEVLAVSGNLLGHDRVARLAEDAALTRASLAALQAHVALLAIALA